MSQSITAEDVVRLFEQDRKACRRLAELLVSDSDIRTMIINAVIRDVATKQDIEKLREETRRDIEKLREEFRQEIEKLRKGTKQEIEKLRQEIKQEIEKLREETRRDIEKLNDRISRLEERVSRLEERVARVEGGLNLLVKMFIAFNVPLLIAVIGIMLKMIFVP